MALGPTGRIRSRPPFENARIQVSEDLRWSWQKPERRAYERNEEAIARWKREAEVVLLGSIASAKYVDLLTAVLGPRLLFPSDFVGRGDMSRGGLMLRCVQERRELPYVPLVGAQRRGSRPARLPPLAGKDAR